MNYGAAEIVFFLVGQMIVAAAIWGGIRADIKAMHQRLDALERRFETHVFNANDTWHGIERRRAMSDDDSP